MTFIFYPSDAQQRVWVVWKFPPSCSSYESVGQQLRAAFDGHLTQIFQVGDDEIEVRVMLPDHERYNCPMVQKCRFQQRCR